MHHQLLSSVLDSEGKASLVVAVIERIICHRVRCRGTDFMSLSHLVDKSNRDRPLRFNIFSLDEDRLPDLQAHALREAFRAHTDAHASESL